MNLSDSPPNHQPPKTLLGNLCGSDALADAERPRIRRATERHERERLRLERQSWERRNEAERARRYRTLAADVVTAIRADPEPFRAALLAVLPEAIADIALAVYRETRQ
jgi:hypothetical protein